MEEHFLKDFVVNMTREAELPRPWYNPDGDCIIYQIADEAIVADRIDEMLTIYRSAIDDRPVGYQIKGVAAVARKFGWDGMSVESVEDGESIMAVSVSALLLAAYEGGPKTISRRKGYARAFESCGTGHRIPIEDLQLS